MSHILKKSGSDIVLLFKGSRFTFDHVEQMFANDADKPVLAFVERGWEHAFGEGIFSQSFETPEDLASKVTAALRSWRNARMHDSGRMSNAFEMVFAPQLTPEQVKSCLEALADYYRALGGAGLQVDFELADVLIEEPANVGA